MSHRFPSRDVSLNSAARYGSPARTPVPFGSDTELSPYSLTLPPLDLHSQGMCLFNCNVLLSDA